MWIIPVVFNLIFLTPMVISPFFKNMEKASALRNYCYVYFSILILFFLHRKWKGNHDEMFSFPKNKLFSFLTGSFLSISLLFFILSQFSRLLAFDVNGVDFSVFDSMLANTLNGKFIFDSHVNQLAHFGVHQNYVLLMILPFYAFFQSPFFLQFINAFFMWMAIIPLFRLSKKITQSDLFSSILVICYLTSPFLASCLNADFRPEIFYPFFIFSFLFYLFENKNTWKVYFILFLCVKEDAAFYGVMLGGYLLFLNRGLFSQARTHGVFVLLSSVIFLGVNIFLLQPYFLHQSGLDQPRFLTFWSNLGTNKREIILNLIRHPFNNIRHLLQSSWTKLYLPFLGLPFASLFVLFVSLPGILLAGFANSDTFIYNYDTYYPLVLFAFALFGVTLAFQRFPRVRPFAILSLLIAPLIGAGWLSLARPKIELLHSLKEAKKTLQAQILPQENVCVSANLQPMFGYDFSILPFSEKNLLTKRCSFVVYSNQLNPYPFPKRENLSILQREHFSNVLFEKEGIIVATWKNSK